MPAPAPGAGQSGDAGPPRAPDEVVDDPAPTGPNVTVIEDDKLFTLANGIVSAKISKESGNLRSLTYNGVEMIHGGYWSHDTSGGKQTLTRVTIDPATHAGDRAEVSVKAISGGLKLGHGPGAEEDGDIAADIEIRYSLGRGEPGLYTYSIFDHPPEYAEGSLAEARFVAGLVDTFDWISVDEKRNRYYPAPVPGEDKYVFTATQSENLAFGFSSTKDQLGFWIVNPTIEYLSGGPTKPEFLCHRNTDSKAAPVVLNYWRSSHYGGASVTVSAGEPWTKVIGPFLLYINHGGDPMALWKDARARAVKEARKWPYSWVSGVDYPLKAERSTVRGKLVLQDPALPASSRGYRGKLMVGLAHPPYVAPSSLGGTREFDWQLNAKHYQFWTRVDDGSGEFAIPNVRPGTYSLYAFADGVLGQFEQRDVTVQGGGAQDLGELTWTPIRRGRQLWEVGIADHSAAEFKNAAGFFQPDVQLLYPSQFPDDVTFRIGESEAGRDWSFQHIPHDTTGSGVVTPYEGVVGDGRATPFSIVFDLPEAPRGMASLRLALTGTGTKHLDVSVNGNAVQSVALGVGDGVITLHQIFGIWYERELAFDASLLRRGSNTLTLTVPAGPLNNGVIYDYLRLELQDAP